MFELLEYKLNIPEDLKEEFIALSLDLEELLSYNSESKETIYEIVVSLLELSYILADDDFGHSAYYINYLKNLKKELE